MVKKRVEKKEKNKKCSGCGKIINPKDRQVSLNTYDQGKIIEKTDWHVNCWRDFFNDRVEKKMKVQVAGMQEQALSLFNSPQLKSLFDQIQGSGMLMNMLKIPLNTDQVISKEKVKIKIQNDRKKRSAKKRKTQMH